MIYHSRFRVSRRFLSLWYGHDVLINIGAKAVAHLRRVYKYDGSMCTLGSLTVLASLPTSDLAQHGHTTTPSWRYALLHDYR